MPLSPGEYHPARVGSQNGGGELYFPVYNLLIIKEVEYQYDYWYHATELRRQKGRIQGGWNTECSLLSFEWRRADSRMYWEVGANMQGRPSGCSAQRGSGARV